MTYFVEIAGRAIPQGSKSAFKLPGGRIAMVESSKQLPAWRQIVAAEAAACSHRPEAPYSEPVVVWLEFMFKRPRSHFTSTGKLAKSAPRFPGRNLGDLDKLTRGVFDGLTGVWIVDDALIVSSLQSKLFGEVDRVRITMKGAA